MPTMNTRTKTLIFGIGAGCAVLGATLFAAGAVFGKITPAPIFSGGPSVFETSRLESIEAGAEACHEKFEAYGYPIKWDTDKGCQVEVEGMWFEELDAMLVLY